jgi:hypothetical protein
MGRKELDVDQKRQVIQLWIASRNYLHKARWAGAVTCQATHRDIKLRFEEGCSPSVDDLQMLYMGADLNSAAVRLGTIDEILHSLQPKRSTSGYQSLVGYFGTKDSPARLELESGMDSWVHILMRHNVAHEEPLISDPKSEAHWRRIQRQHALEDLTVAQAFKSLTLIFETLKKVLDGGVVKLPS